MYTVAILFVVLLFQFLYFRLLKYKSLKNIPNFRNWSIGPSAHIDNMFEEMLSINKNLGPIVKVWTSPMTAKLMVADAAVVQAILSSTNNLRKTKFYEYLLPFIGTGLGTSPVHIWKKERKLINPAFNMKLMEAYDNIFEYHGEELVDILRREINKSSLDLVPFLDLYALDLICEAIAGVRTHLQREVDQEYLNARSTFLTIVMNRVCSPFKGYNTLFKLTPEYKTQKKCMKVVNNFSRRLINESHKTNVKTNTESKFRNILDILEYSGFDQDRIIDHLNTFIVAGHDTAATIIAFALYEIAENPEIQKRIVEESIRVLGRDKKAIITTLDMQNMVYLEAVIKECLRYYPGLTFIERKPQFELRVGDVVIPADMDVVINIYGLHRNEEYFEKANQFIPDRFLPGSLLKMNHQAYVPFSKGPRDCIGKTFAMFLLKSLISKVVRNFELLPADPKHKVVLTSEFVIKSATGLKVQLRERVL